MSAYIFWNTLNLLVQSLKCVTLFTASLRADFTAVCILCVCVSVSVCVCVCLWCCAWELVRTKCVHACVCNIQELRHKDRVCQLMCPARALCSLCTHTTHTCIHTTQAYIQHTHKHTHPPLHTHIRTLINTRNPHTHIRNTHAHTHTQHTRTCTHTHAHTGEDVSGMPTLCRPWQEGGMGFDYRLQVMLQFELRRTITLQLYH